MISELFDNPSIFNKIRNMLIGGKHKFNIEAYSAINPSLNETILELGCGTGELSEFVILNSDYLGLDNSQRFLNKARLKYPNKNFINMDVKDILSLQKEFNKTIIVNFLHHFEDREVISILNNVKSITKNKVIIIDAIRPINKISNLLVRLDRGDYIRTAEDQLNLIGLIFKIEHTKLFKSGLYTFLVLICSKKGTKNIKEKEVFWNNETGF